MRLPRHHTRLLTQLVIALQCAVLLTWFVTPRWNPPRGKLIELLWASMHQPQFYPLVTLLLAGPVCTLVAWRRRGRHRYVLLAGWAVFALVTLAFFGDRAATMLRVLWWRVGE